MHLIFGDKLVDDDAWEAIHRSPCTTDPNRFKIIATVGRSLRDVLPIIYLSQLNSEYMKSPDIVSYDFQRHNILIGHDGSVAITFIKDDDEMNILRSKVIQTINNAIIYNLTHHTSLDDLIEKKRVLSPMMLYKSFKALPEADCGECGEKSCFGFTTKLYIGERNVGGCPYVNTTKIQSELIPLDL